MLGGGVQSMKLSDIGVQFGDFDLCVMHFKLTYMVGSCETPYPMVICDRYSDPMLHVTTMLYRTQAQFAKHLTMQQNMVSFQHLDMIITYVQANGRRMQYRHVPFRGPSELAKDHPASG